MAVAQEVLVARSRLLPPHIQRDWISRPDRLHALAQADHAPVTLIVAPAGSGKSGLLAQWAVTRREPVAWLTLDARDNSLVALATMLAYAINAVEPDTIAAPLRYLEFVTGAPDPEVVGTHVLNDLADLTADLSLVLDNVHLITDPAAVALIQVLVASPMPGLRVLCAARSEPPWPLAPLRASGRLLELRAADLRMTPAETGAYAQRVWGEPVTAEMARSLCESTAGWLAGIRFLCAGSRRFRRPDATGRVVDPTLSGEAMGWLLNEALTAYDDPMRALLLRFAIPERLNRALAEALAGDLCDPRTARAAYDALVEDGLFLVDAGEAGWSRIPGHVRQILIPRLAENEGVAAVRRWRGIARDWLVAQGRYDEAIGQARAMGDLAAVAGVIAAAIEPMLVAEEWRTLETWLAELPEQVVARDPELLLGSARVVQHREDLARARELVQDARRRIAAAAPLSPVRQQTLTARADVLEGGIAYMLGDARGALDLVTGAIPRLPPESAYSLAQAHFVGALSAFRVDPSAGAARIASHLAGAAVLPPAASLQLWAALGIITYQQGDMRRTEKIAAKMRDLGAAQGSGWVASWGDALAAIATYERNELDAAIAHATALLERTRSMHRIAVRECLYVLALSYAAKQQWDDADTTLERLEEFVLTENTPRTFVEVDALRARFAVRRGETDAARSWFDRTTLPAALHPSHSLGDARVAHLTVAVDLGIDLQPTIGRIEQLLAAGRMFDTLVRRAELMILLAIAAFRLGDADRARAVLAEAMALSQPAGLTRVFLDLGHGLLPVLDDAITHGVSPASEAKRLRELIAAEAAVAGRASPLLRRGGDLGSAASKPLTEREQEVLALVAERSSNKEIAARLGISPLTVKRHTINIYAKLGVSSRRQAIEMAHRASAAGV